MKLIHRLSLFVIIALVSLPLVILAQDQPTPAGNNDDLFVPLPNNNDDDLFVPLPTAGNDDDLFVPLPTAGNDDDLFVPIPTVGNDDDLFVPIPTAGNDDDLFVPIPTVGNDDDLFVPLPEPDTCGNDDPSTEFIPICPPDVTVTPRPQSTARPSVSVINGLWVLDPNNDFSSTGSCRSPNSNDNGGPDHDFSGEEEEPTYPVCMTADKQWLSVAAIGTFPLTVPPFYSQQQMRRELVETNGKTSGSMNVTYTRQYNVISPTQIEYSYIYQESGGCTTKNTFRYTLKEANDLVCTGALITPVYTPEPTLISTAKPGETQVPVVTPVPPVQQGRYIITLPNDGQCAADKMPPSDKMDMSYDSNQNLFINFGGSSYTLYWDGGNFYQYREGNKFSISLYASATQTNFTWRNQDCRIDSSLMREGAPTPTPVPVEPTSTGNTDGTVVTAGDTFTTTTQTQDALCAPENKELLPDLTTAVLKAQADGNFEFTSNGVQYTLVNQNGYYVFSKANGDGTSLTISMNGFYEGKGSGVYTVVGAGGKMCTALLTFTPAG